MDSETVAFILGIVAYPVGRYILRFYAMLFFGEE